MRHLLSLTFTSSLVSLTLGETRIPSPLGHRPAGCPVQRRQPVFTAKWRPAVRVVVDNSALVWTREEDLAKHHHPKLHSWLRREPQGSGVANGSPKGPGSWAGGLLVGAQAVLASRERGLRGQSRTYSITLRIQTKRTKQTPKMLE